MFKIGDSVVCVCAGDEPPAGTVGTVKEGPQSTLEGNLYKVHFKGFGILVMHERCLSLNNSFNMAESSKSVRVISKYTKVKEGTKGVISSEPQMLFGKVFFDVLFEGQTELIKVAKSSIASDSAD